MADEVGGPGRGQLPDELLELLFAVVEASRRQSSSDKEPFLLTMTHGGDHVIHRALPDGSVRSNEQDVETLARYGLISAKRTQKHTMSFYVTPEGFAHYDRLKSQGRAPTENIEADLRHLVDSDRFRSRYPEAQRKWAAAESLLWADRQGSESTIGHLCREAMQEFAQGLVDRYKLADVSTNKAEDVNRVRAVIASRKAQVSTSRAALLDALLVYWGTTTDLVQRQEHSGAKEGEPVTWDDSRTVVLHTLILFAELDRSLA
jgi:hypothetical protein